MEKKTIVNAEDNRQEILITRDFDLPVELLFKAYEDAAILEQWMGTRVLKLENRAHGGYRFETKDAEGKVVFSANGVIHEFSPNQRITRTFEMENSGFPVQIEYLEFTASGDQQSKLRMQIVFRSVADRNELLKLPFSYGLNMAHNRLQQVLEKLNLQS